MKTPRYPVYVPSKDRAEKCLTARFLRRDGVPFKLVVEPQEVDAYAREFGEDCILTLPWNDPGSVIPARNWIKAHATAEGYKRHWQLDDNYRHIMRVWAGRRLRCRAGVALAITEDLTDRYENIAVAGLNYVMFVASYATPGSEIPPFRLNCHVYSCTLTSNETDHQWRGPYNEDTDYCLQVLADGWCTLQMNAFVIDKITTMTMKGGNTDALYHGDGRLKMARCLERRWPGVVETKRRFGRPQHVVDWSQFTTPLKRREDIDWDALETSGPDNYGMKLKKVK